MTTAARRLGLRLFIEGIEVPVISATVQGAMLQPARANIEVPFSDEMTELFARSVVHLFHYDARNPTAEEQRAADNTVVPETGVVSIEDESWIDPERWHLLFTGELIGYQYVKRENQRHGVLVCNDFTSYWEACKVYFGNKTLGNKHFKQAIFMGAAQMRRGKRKLKGANKLLKILRTRPTTIPKLQGLLGGIVHLLESITGVFDRKAKKRFRGTSDFFSQAELRLKLTKQLGASPNDLSSRYLTGSKKFRKLIKRVSRQLRGTSSYAQLVSVLLQQIYHAHYPVLAPPYRPPGIKTKVLKLVRIGSGSRLKKSTKGLSSKLDEVENYLTGRLAARKQAVEGRAVPDSYKYTVDKVTTKVSTDDAGHEEWSNVTKGRLPGTRRTVNDAITAIDAAAGDPDERKNNKKSLTALKQRAIALQKAINIFETNLTKKTQLQIDEPESGIGPANVTSIYPRHDEASVLEADQLLRKAARAGKRARRGPRYKTVSQEIELGDRLITTLFCPEIWMVPPPKCNILFPEQYSNYQYGRQFLVETTRLWMHGLKRNGRANLSRLYFAPNVDMINGQVGKKTAGRAAAQSISFLMPHEKYTGIIPSMQGLGNLESLRKINKIVEKKEGGPSVTSWRAKDPALARASNYEFFRQRFQSRQLSGVGPFNPGLVIGLPAMLLDPRVVSTRLSETAKVQVKGKHYIGLLTGLKHQVNQRGGSTTFQFGYVRAHDEGLNIFGEVEEGTVSVTKKLKFRRGGRRVDTRDGTHAVAEVFGFTQKKVKRKSAVQEKGFPSHFYVSRLVPVIGMLGVKGRSGKHITAGLSQQSNVMVKSQTSLGFKGSDIKGFSSDLSAGPPENPGLSSPTNSLDVGVKDFNFVYRVSPKKFKDRTDGDVTSDGATRRNGPTRITKIQYIDGYKYLPKKPWMSSRAIGAVAVDAFRLNRSAPKVKKRNFTFSFEMIARPPWLADIYLNQNIGNTFYLDLFGCKSLTDLTLVTESPVPDGSDFKELQEIGGAVGPTGSIKKLSGLEALGLKTLAATDGVVKQLKTIADIFTDLKEEDDVEDRTKVLIETQEGDSFEVAAKVIGGVPIQVAAEQLAETYVVLKASKETDIWSFVETYTARKFCNMREIFGYGYRSGDPNDSGEDVKGVIGTTYVSPDAPFDQADMFVEQPEFAEEGFHSFAFGDFTGMDLIDHEPLTNAHGDGKKKIQKFVDPRKHRYFAAINYRDSLKGVLGEKS